MITDYYYTFQSYQVDDDPIEWACFEGVGVLVGRWEANLTLRRLFLYSSATKRYSLEYILKKGDQIRI